MLFNAKSSFSSSKAPFLPGQQRNQLHRTDQIRLLDCRDPLGGLQWCRIPRPRVLGLACLQVARRTSSSAGHRRIAAFKGRVAERVYGRLDRQACLAGLQA